MRQRRDRPADSRLFTASPYSRAQRVQGTKGIWMEDKNAVHFDSDEGEEWTPMSDLYENHEHPVWKEFMARGVKGDTEVWTG